MLTPLFGERPGIEAATTLARERAGFWVVYAVLMICVSFHTAIGLYRLAIKWGSGSRLSRRSMRGIEHAILWIMLGLGGLDAGRDGGADFTAARGPDRTGSMSAPQLSCADVLVIGGGLAGERRQRWP